MRIQKLFIPVIILSCFFVVQSCKKSDGPTPDPTPVVMPDTLGVGWTKKIIADETNLTDVVFNSPTAGFMVGNKIYRSTDGGNNWTVVSSNSSQNIAITGDNKAFFVLSNGIYRTLNGGISFDSTGITGTPTDIFFIDNNNGFCIAMGSGLYKTTDGGVTWTHVNSTGLPSGQYLTLSVINSTTGWVSSESAAVRSVGSFATWQPVTLNGSNAGFGSLFAVSASNIYAGTWDGQIFKSTNGGNSFSLVKKFDNGGFTDIHFFNDQEGYASSGRHIYKTADGGLNWTTVVSLGESGIIELHFTDTNHGWACGGNVVLAFKQ